MKQALAAALIITQQKVIANPPTFVKITKKYQRRASTPALSNTSSLTNSVSGAAGRAGSPEVSSSNQSGTSASGSAGSLGVQDFMNPDILKTVKLWRFQKLSRGSALILKDGCLVGIHQEAINALRERLQHAKLVKDRLTEAEKSIDAIVNGGGGTRVLCSIGKCVLSVASCVALHTISCKF
ncbi:TPA: hypothetical protein ACH3X3_010041 [Trebouxia sp. C0006]